MTDVENEVYTRIAEMLRAAFPGVSVSSEYVKSPSAFPHVSVTQNDSYPVAEREDSSLTENTTLVLFEVNAYSNRASGRKMECKRLMNAVNELLRSMNFRRLAMTPVPNLEDATIYRITARYRAATDGKYFYRR